LRGVWIWQSGRATSVGRRVCGRICSRHVVQTWSFLKEIKDIALDRVVEGMARLLRRHSIRDRAGSLPRNLNTSPTIPKSLARLDRMGGHPAAILLRSLQFAYSVLKFGVFLLV
jgi:hypothetical protein